MDLFQQICLHPVVAIIRGADPATVPDIVRALQSGGVRAVEVTYNSPGALSLVEKLAVDFGGDMLIGMGTILDTEQARAALDAGARFLISPHFNPDVISLTRQRGGLSIPGAFTPTEIVNAYQAGGQLIKLFPASGNWNYVRELRAPLPHIPLMPTGGVSLDNIRQFREAGATAFGIGTALVNTSEKVTEATLSRITDRAVQFTRAVQ